MKSRRGEFGEPCRLYAVWWCTFVSIPVVLAAVGTPFINKSCPALLPPRRGRSFHRSEPAAEPPPACAAASLSVLVSVCPDPSSSLLPSIVILTICCWPSGITCNQWQT